MLYYEAFLIVNSNYLYSCSITYKSSLFCLSQDCFPGCKAPYPLKAKNFQHSETVVCCISPMSICPETRMLSY